MQQIIFLTEEKKGESLFPRTHDHIVIMKYSFDIVKITIEHLLELRVKKFVLANFMRQEVNFKKNNLEIVNILKRAN